MEEVEGGPGMVYLRYKEGEGDVAIDKREEKASKASARHLQEFN